MKIINFHQHELQIHKEGFLYWLEKKCVIVSDLHLEKGSSYAVTGQFIPPYDSHETLNRLIGFIKKRKVTKLILLGDTFHDEGAYNRMSIKAKSLFNRIIENYEVIFVLGNHESKMKIDNLNFHKEYVIDNVHFLHEAVNNNFLQISGHFHPVASIKLSKKKITEKCLIHSNNHLILPSFGEFTGGLNIKNKALKLFVTSDSDIYFLTKKSVYLFKAFDIKA